MTPISFALVQHIFSVRAFVEPADSQKLIVTQAKNEGLARKQILERLRASRVFLAADTPEIRTAQATELRKAWAEFKTSAKGPTAIKDARLALVVGLIEGVNFFKLMSDCKKKNDSKSYFGLLASGMSLTSAMLDIASVPAKSLFGNEAWSYQKLKLYGGVLSGSAALIMATFDAGDAIKAKKKGKSLLTSLYAAKAILGGSGGLITLATTFTYAAPLVERITGRAAIGLAVRAVGARAAAIIGARILLMSAGAWITAGVLIIQVAIWIFTDDALQDWCEGSAFGESKDKRVFKDVKSQEESLAKALVEVF